MAVIEMKRASGLRAFTSRANFGFPVFVQLREQASESFARALV
jgi:hypothetical protein